VKELRFDLKIWYSKKWGFEIWQNDLNPFQGRLETRVKNLIRDLPVTARPSQQLLAPSL